MECTFRYAPLSRLYFLHKINNSTSCTKNNYSQTLRKLRSIPTLRFPRFGSHFLNLRARRAHARFGISKLSARMCYALRSFHSLRLPPRNLCSLNKSNATLCFARSLRSTSVPIFLCANISICYASLRFLVRSINLTHGRDLRSASLHLPPSQFYSLN